MSLHQLFLAIAGIGQGSTDLAAASSGEEMEAAEDADEFRLGGLALM